MKDRTLFSLLLLCAGILFVLVWSGCRQRAAAPLPSAQSTISSSEADSLARIKNIEAAWLYVERLCLAFGGDSTNLIMREEAMPDYFGGLYYNEKGQLVVQIVGDSLEGRRKIEEIVQGNDFQVEHIVKTYSERELKRIMDECGELLSKVPDIRRNFMSASVNVYDHRIDIQLIVTNEKTVKEFREKVMDSPAFHFIKRDYGLAPTNGVQDINGLYLRTEYPIYHTSTDSVKVIFYNRNVLQTYSGSAYKIAYEEDGVWKILPKNDITTLLAYRTDPNSDYSFIAHLLPDIHTNKPGRYRIYYEVTLGEDIRGGEEYNLIAEFRLSDNKEECLRAVKTEVPAFNPKVDLSKLYEVDKNGNIIYSIAEQMPEFPGGYEQLIQYVEEKARTYTFSEEGRVVVSFLVGKDGKAYEPKVVRGVNDTLNNAALQIIESLPKFKPGKQGSKSVIVKFTLPILFRKPH